MSAAVIDLCPVPPAWADDKGGWGVIDDSWRGIEHDDAVEWLSDTNAGPLIAHPASAVDAMAPEGASAALYPLFHRFMEKRETAEDDWLALLLPAGTSLQASRPLRDSVQAAGWTGAVFLADGGPLLAMGEAWSAPEKSGYYSVFREREHLTETSLVRVEAEANILRAELLWQCRDADSEHAESRMRQVHKEIGCVLNQPSILQDGERLIACARLLEGVRKSEIILEIKRNAWIGLRRGVWDFLPLLQEASAITESRLVEIASDWGEISRLEFWFGYPESAVHPLTESRTVHSRCDAAPKRIRCRMERLMDGGAAIAIEWDAGSGERRMAFPILCQSS
ncbi:MAG: hypothetical protein AB1656_15895 [Candidatus Omnitrophota bacterium]